MNPLVSVVIPAYNAEAAIETSVNSVLAQTWKNTEVIVVDDGSVDKTAEVVNKLAKEDSRIKFLQHETNKGSLTARLTGIEAASGEFIAFLDSDDYLDNAAISTCLTQKTDDGCLFDIVHFGFEVHYKYPRFSADVEWTDNYCQPPAEKRYGAEISHLIFNEQRAPWSLCGKLFKTSIVKKAAGLIPTQKLTMAEDTCTCFHICAFAKTYIGIPSLRAYHYNIDSGGSAAVEQNLSLKQFQKYCEYAPAMEVIKNFVNALPNNQSYIKDYEAIKNNHIDACIIKLLENVPQKDKPEAFKILLKHWGAVEVVSRLANRYNNNARACIKDLCLDAAINKTPGSVKTIAIYYVRIHTGGAEKVTVALINLWTAMGYKVVLFTDEEPNDSDYKIDADIPRVVLPFSQNTNSDGYRARANALESAIKKYNIDTLVYCSFIGRLLTWDMLLTKTLGTRFVVHTHSSFLRFFSNNMVHEVSLGTAYKLADAIITLNDSDTAFWREANSNTHQVQNPITLFKDNQISAKRKFKCIIWVGRLCMGEKCPDEAIKIMSYVHELEPDAKLIFVGADNDPHTAKVLRNMVSDMKLQECVEFTGELDDVASQMRKSSIFLLTSRYEGYCLALAESKAVGLPCVMYEIPYLTTTKGNRGIVPVRQKDAKAAAYAIYNLLNNETEYNRLSNEAFTHAKELCEYNYKAAWKNVFKSLGSKHNNNDIVEQGRYEWDKTDVLALGCELATKDHAEEVRYLHCEIDARDRRIAEVESELAQKQRELDELKNSTSHKLGSALMALPCKLKDAVMR